jgi:hypothetical protein
VPHIAERFPLPVPVLHSPPPSLDRTAPWPALIWAPHPSMEPPARQLFDGHRAKALGYPAPPEPRMLLIKIRVRE